MTRTYLVPVLCWASLIIGVLWAYLAEGAQETARDALASALVAAPLVAILIALVRSRSAAKR